MGVYHVRYLLRDEDNFKEYYAELFSGPPGVELKDFEPHCINGDGFLPAMVDLPRLSTTTNPDPHAEHELFDVTYHEEDDGGTLPPISRLLAAFAAASAAGWKPTKRARPTPADGERGRLLRRLRASRRALHDLLREVGALHEYGVRRFAEDWDPAKDRRFRRAFSGKPGTETVRRLIALIDEDLRPRAARVPARRAQGASS